jgi:predicted lipoprotein with Yx(FWY)xxD motif
MAATPASTTAGLKVASSTLGTIVVSDSGMTVYQFTKDVKDSGKSSCTGGCLAAWPPVLTTADTPALSGVTGKVGTITTPEGAKQVTLNGLPLYYWAQDSAPGDVTGQGVQNVWYVVAPNGEMIK